MQDIRNIAIIAHVDHGKTTIIDQMLRQSGQFRENQAVDERVMDSNDLEKERGITILAKCTSVTWKDTRINVIDTPGHADFGGEVERVLSMADGVILLVDSAEGAMPQTKFVLTKALAQGLRPIVVINKIDRADRREEEVVDEVFDLFVNLGANDDQLDFPILYAAGRDGWCINEMGDEQKDLTPLLDKILEHVPAPTVDREAPFSMLVTLLSADPFLGRILTGRVLSGSAKINSSVKSLSLDGKTVETGRLTKLFTFDGVDRIPVEEVNAGDIIAIAGMSTTNVADTICDPAVTVALESTPIDPPTMSVTFSVNNSPLGGTEGSKVTSTMIYTRLMEEAETNVAINVSKTDNNDSFEVGGRGELQIGVLIETMRREGFELLIARPQVLLRKDENGKTTEPIEEVVIDVDEEHSGTVVEKLSKRKGNMIEMKPSGVGKTRMIFHVPSRGMIGYQNEFMTDTRGTGIINRIYHAHEIYKGAIDMRGHGSLISMNQGEAVAYAIFNLQDRGTMFVSPQDRIYEGMIVGENTREQDMEINVLKGKQLTNVRASGTDEAVKLTPPVKMSLEDMIAYISEDELVEVTPKSLRLRKRNLSATDRKRVDRSKQKLG
jgi:GTP-binding protein